MVMTGLLLGLAGSPQASHATNVATKESLEGI